MKTNVCIWAEFNEKSIQFYIGDTPFFYSPIDKTDYDELKQILKDNKMLK